MKNELTQLACLIAGASLLVCAVIGLITGEWWIFFPVLLAIGVVAYRTLRTRRTEDANHRNKPGDARPRRLADR